MRDSEVFEMAAVIIDVNGWGKNLFLNRETGEVCIEGAIGLAIADDAFLLVRHELARAQDPGFVQGKRCQMLLENEVLHGTRAFGWNDCSQRTVEEVQKALEDAARIAAADEAYLDQLLNKTDQMTGAAA